VIKLAILLPVRFERRRPNNNQSRRRGGELAEAPGRGGGSRFEGRRPNDKRGGGSRFEGRRPNDNQPPRLAWGEGESVEAPGREE
jgi:hypothetical protein